MHPVKNIYINSVSVVYRYQRSSKSVLCVAEQLYIIPSKNTSLHQMGKYHTFRTATKLDAENFTKRNKINTPMAHIYDLSLTSLGTGITKWWG